MATKIPSVLADFNAFFADKSYAGRANKVTLPKIAVKTIEIEGAGIGGSIKRSLGKLEAMESEVTVSDYDEKLIGFVGDPRSRNEPILFRGALDQNGEIKTCLVRMRGFWSEMDFNEWSGGGSEATQKFKIEIEFLEIELNGKKLLTIDKLNNDFIGPDGVNKNKLIKQALGQ